MLFVVTGTILGFLIILNLGDKSMLIRKFFNLIVSLIIPLGVILINPAIRKFAKKFCREKLLLLTGRRANKVCPGGPLKP